MFRRSSLTVRAAATLALGVGSLALPAPASIAATGGSSSGWGTEASYIGRYHLNVLPLSERATSVPATSSHAAIFSGVVGACERLTATATHPTGGELTMFMREVKKGKPLVPSGILNLKAQAGNELVYLTYLSASGTKLHAKINGGAFVGPVVGSFEGTKTGPNTISGTAIVESVGTVEATFTRFSSSPQP